METLLSAITALFLTLAPTPAVDSSFDRNDIEWSCTAPQWPGTPTVSGGQFRGTMAVDCRFEGAGAPGNGYEKLKDFMVGEALSLALEVHAGPSEEKFEAMPGTYLDTTTDVTAQGTNVRVRADLHFATDGTTKIIYANQSKQITGSGNGKYLRAVRSRMEIRSGQNPGFYTARTEMALVLDKPNLVPGGIFKNRVVQEVESQVPGEAKATIEKIAPHL